MKASKPSGEAEKELPIEHHPVDEQHHDRHRRPEGEQHQGRGGPTSRRNTRIAGTRDSCSRAAERNPASSATAVTKPIPTGTRLAAGRALLVKQAAQRVHQPRLGQDIRSRSR